MNPTTVTLAVDWFETGTGLGNDLKALIINIIIPVLCLAFVVLVGLRTRAPGPTIMACIFASILWGLASDMSMLKEKTSETITQYDGGTLKPMDGDQ